MAIKSKVDLKQPIVEEIKSLVDGAASAVIVDYRGLTVEQDTKFRKELREAGVTYKVYKNTMMKLAFKGTDCEPLCDALDGTNALAVSKTEATTAAAIIAKYAKETQKLQMKGGVIEGTYYDEAGMTAIAAVPSREVLLGRLLGSMQSPITNLARVLNQIAEKNAEA